jgi:hypothetical protein
MSDPTQPQSHQETLRLLLNSDTSPCLYAHEVEALTAAIAALDEVDALKIDLEGASHNRFYDQRDAYFEGLSDGKL